MKISKKECGVLPNGINLVKYTIENSSGFKVGVINYGAAITEIFTPDRDGKFENVVLGYEKIESYIENPAYLGCVVGRTAGRISNGSFTLNGEKYNLDKNNNGNNLHGGVYGLSKKIWDVDETKNGVLFSCRSGHLEGGFPGEVEFNVKYSVTEDNSLEIEYLAETDMETLINMTNHTYFNLSGDMKLGGERQFLKIDSDFFCKVDEQILPTGEKISVASTNFDFKKLKEIGDGLEHLENDSNLKFAKGYDHPFILNPTIPQITLFSCESGRLLEIETDQKVVVFYSGNYLEGIPNLEGGKVSENNIGICLETQDYPDALNVEGFPLETYSKEKNYKAKSIWRFSVKNENH